MSTLTIYNTLTRRKEAFIPLVPGQAGIYVCGPTVYDYIHIGNARTFSVFDLVVRWLRASGLAVRYVRNITDVDDKIMERARGRGEPIEALTERTVAAFAEDCARLNLLVPDSEPRATRYIGPMLELIGVLEEKGLAYRGANGDVYYSVRDFRGYGKLSRRNLDDLRAGERVAVEAAKRDPLDFVLWKAAKPGEPSWPSLFGEGRPGWHIECSAMSCRELGATFDIHGGGWDLQFPHHENEIAQSEGANGRPFVNYWMHSAFLNMGDEKMSKSIGNVFTAREVLARLDPVQGGEQLRFFLLRGHYRSELNYTWDLLEDAGNTLRGFYTALREVPAEQMPCDWSHPFAQRFRDAMNDDFDTPVALAVLHELRGEVNRTRSRALSGLLKGLGAAIGFLQQDPVAFLQGRVSRLADDAESAKDSGSADARVIVRHPDGDLLDIEALRDERTAAKKAKEFARADDIRRRLDEAGIVLEDKPGGLTEWRKK
ncbi:MAG: cysteine--tRNA ligase [Betaproteobacteria bacterium]|nr:cysteine--tRNA ligase [Betaproteobacteria bacterium]